MSATGEYTFMSLRTIVVIVYILTKHYNNLRQTLLCFTLIEEFYHFKFYTHPCFTMVGLFRLSINFINSRIL